MGLAWVVTGLALLGQTMNPTADQRLLAQELDADLRAYRATLPAREGPLTINAVYLNGTEIVYTGIIDSDTDEAGIERFRQIVVQELCAGAQTGATIRRGGAFTYDLRDAGGERFITTVSRCE